MRHACAVVGACFTLGGGVAARQQRPTTRSSRPRRTGRSRSTGKQHDHRRGGRDRAPRGEGASSPRRRASARKDAYELLLQGARQGIPIYWFNRAPGSGRETVIFEGDPLTPENKELLLDPAAARRSSAGRSSGIGPEVADEEIVRAMMAVRANTMVYEAASPQLTQALLDLLNKNISPVVQSRGSPGEGDLPQMSNVGATMVGAGQAYLQRPEDAGGGGARARRPAAARAVRGRRRGADEHERVLRRAGGAARARREAVARLVGPDVLDEHARAELERHADRGRAAGGAAVPVPELAGQAAAAGSSGAATCSSSSRTASGSSRTR